MDARRPEALPKQKRLAKRREFLHVYETGRKLFSRYTVVFFAPNASGQSRLGITATKKTGKAHTRNLVKRRTRDVYRRHRQELGIDGCAIDLVVNVKPNAPEASFVDFEKDLVRLLQRVVKECGAK
ncbi:MAG: ribonuclease P protein component [Thermoanaerobaculia bacterium]